MADMGQDELISALNYLGKSTTIPLTGSQNLPTAAAAGAIPAPSTAAAGQSTGGSQSLGLTGGGLIPQPGTGGVDLLGGAGKLTDIAKQLFGAPDQATRGNTGGTSLSDQVRSGSSSPTGTGTSTLPIGGGEGSALSADSGILGQSVDPGAMINLQPQTAGDAFALISGGGGSAAQGISSYLGGAGGGLAGGAEGASSLANLGMTGADLAASGLGGLVFGGISAIPSVLEIGRSLFEHQPDPLAETKGIRSDFNKAAPGFLGSGATYQAIQNIDQSLPKAQQVQQLQGLLDQAQYQLAQGPAVSQFISTHGGAKKGMVSPVDTAGLEGVSGPASADAVLSGLMATDRLAKLGAWTPEQDAASPFGNPEGWLGILMAQGGVKGIESGPNSGGVDTSGSGRSSPYAGLLTGDELQSLKAPGSRMEALQGILSRLNPDFGGSTLGGLMPQAPTAPPVQASSTAQQGVNALGAGAPSPDTLATPGGTSEEEQLKKLLGGL